jgi:hypothetical protein
LGRGSGDVFAPQRVPVHPRVGQGRQIQGGGYVGGQDLAEAVHQRFLFRTQGSETGHDTLEGFFHVEHSFVHVAVAVNVGGLMVLMGAVRMLAVVSVVTVPFCLS